jgi:hypothetical protein
MNTQHDQEVLINCIDLIIRNLSDNGPNVPSSNASNSSSGSNQDQNNITMMKNKKKKQKVTHESVLSETESLCGESASSHGYDTNKIMNHDRTENDNDGEGNSRCKEDFSKEFHRRFAPVGLERQYHELYQILEKGLIGVIDYSSHEGSSKSTRRLKKTNVSALLMGPRGEGKSLVLDRCLLALEQRAHDEFSKQQQQQQQQQSHGQESHSARFRVVRLNGILLRGENVAIVVQEIVRQLCDIVTRESCRLVNKRPCNKDTNEEILHTNNNDQNKNDAFIIQEKLQQLMQKQAQQFRSKVTTFNSTMACLNEAFQISCIDSIPILIVLEELDSFLPVKMYRLDAFQKHASIHTSGNSNISGPSTNSNRNPGTDSMSSMILSSPRDLLLYHLLDRVAGKGSLISLVGMCARLTTTDSYEKRVRSRAQGTSTVIYFNLYPHPSLQHQKDDGNDDSAQDSFYLRLVDALMSNFVTESKSTTVPRIGLFVTQLKDAIQSILLPCSMSETRSQDESTMDEKYRVYKIFKMNRELGKSIRWFCRVLSIALTLYCNDIQESHSMDREKSRCIPPFNDSYLLEGLQAMGADDFVSERRTAASFDTNRAQDENTLSRTNRLSSRESDLIGLSGCQVAILVSAKRIMERDLLSEHDGLVIQKPLTYERIRREYESHFLMKMKSNGPDCYSDILFFKAFLLMLGRIFFIEKDHTEGGPNQYYFCKRYTLVGMHPEVLKRTPLHVGVDMEKDVMTLLLAGKLNCSMALKDWAKVNCA